jgi:hypothetical protein
VVSDTALDSEVSVVDLDMASAVDSDVVLATEDLAASEEAFTVSELKSP